MTDAVVDRYKSEYEYDLNGNILSAIRYDETGGQYDNLAYKYQTADEHVLRNRLYELYDEATATTGADIEHHPDQGEFDNTAAGVNRNNNYQYDELGNLAKDKREEIDTILWTVAGKVKYIGRPSGSTKPELAFAYGADGQRIMKQVGNPLTGGYKEYYIRDAQGNVMATYRYTNNGAASLKLTDRPIYGSSRIGSHTQEMELYGAPNIFTYPYTQPMPAVKKRYELTDHLGNVNTVVTGRLLPILGISYQAEVVSAQGYEPFGALLPGRNWSSDSYRWGFNGQEKDDEVYGATGTSYTAEFWQYDARTARRWNLDPVFKPWQSSYSTFSGNPISRIDPQGDDDYFNADGSFSHSTKTGHNIVIRSPDAGDVLLSAYMCFEPLCGQAMNKIAQHYGQQVGTGDGFVGFGRHTKYNSSASRTQQGALAFTSGNDIFINTRGGINPLLNDSRNMRNALVHERLHRDAKHGFAQSGSEGMSNFEHAGVFLQQMQDPTFKETTPDYKETAMRAASGLLALAAKDEMTGDMGSGDMTGINNMVAEFNKLSSTSGFTMSVDYTGSGGSNPDMHSYEGRIAPVQKKK